MKTALITGASSGIGYELAHLFAADNYNLVLIARRKQQLENLAQQLENKYSIKVFILDRDLSIHQSIRDIYNFTKEQNLCIDVLVNNAGFGLYGFFTETDWETENRMMQLNMVALTHLTKLYCKEMVANRMGKILNIASTAAFQPGPLWAVYFATKAYVLSFSEALENELKGTGVSITVLCPGPTDSEFAMQAKVLKNDLFDTNIPSSKEVAMYGYKKMMQGSTIAVHGFKNRFLSLFLLRFAPRKAVTLMVRKMMQGEAN